jgi:hypothetical protein
VSLSLKHVHIDRSCVVQDAREVQTKFSKTSTVYFFPVEPEVASIVKEWVRYLTTEKLWSLDDPLFPATRVELDADRQFEAMGLDRKHWTTAGSIRKIFKEAFEAAGLSYFCTAQLPQNTGEVWRATLPHSGGVQGLEPKSGSREGPYHIRQLRRGNTHATGRDHPPTRHSASP